MQDTPVFARDRENLNQEVTKKVWYSQDKKPLAKRMISV
jgi:hypothetical protein